MPNQGCQSEFESGEAMH